MKLSSIRSRFITPVLTTVLTGCVALATAHSAQADIGDRVSAAIAASGLNPAQAAIEVVRTSSLTIAEAISSRRKSTRGVLSSEIENAIGFARVLDRLAGPEAWLPIACDGIEGDLEKSDAAANACSKLLASALSPIAAETLSTLYLNGDEAGSDFKTLSIFVAPASAGTGIVEILVHIHDER